MSEKPEDKDLYNILRSSIDNMETEPSESFWNKAFDNILQKEIPEFEQKVSGWKRATIILAFTVAGLIGYSIYTHHEVKDIEQRMAAIERNQLKSVDSVIAYTPGNSVATSSSNTSSAITDPQVQNNNGILAGKNTIALNGNTSVTASVTRNNRPFSKKANHTITRKKQQVASQQEAPPLPELDATSDTINVAPVREIALVRRESLSKSRFSVSAFLAPSITMQNIKNNNSNNAAMAGMLKSGENQQIACAFGVNFGYDLSCKWTIELGCAYQKTAFSINPTILKPIAGEEGPYYSLATTSGTIYIPAASSIPGDVSGSAELSTISIPLKLKYNFFGGSRLRLYACAGGSVNILVSNSATINYLGQSNEEEIMTNNMDGTKDLNLSCLIGLGAEYKLGRGFSAYAEPLYQQAITPQCSNTAISVYPGYFDVAAGLSFHF